MLSYEGGTNNITDIIFQIQQLQSYIAPIIPLFIVQIIDLVLVSLVILASNKALCISSMYQSQGARKLSKQALFLLCPPNANSIDWSKQVSTRIYQMEPILINFMSHQSSSGFIWLGSIIVVQAWYSSWQNCSYLHHMVLL